YRTRYAYDKNGHLIRQAQEVTSVTDGGGFGNTAADYTNFSLEKANDPTHTIDNPDVDTHLYTYDEAGRRLSETSGALVDDGSGDQETTRYQYDLLGHVISMRTPRGSEWNYEYDAFGLGHKTREIQPQLAESLARDSQSWSYDYFGKLIDHTDLGGAVTSYHYGEETGLLMSQTSSLGQNINYQYDAAEHIVKTLDQGTANTAQGLSGVNRQTEYVYDAAGRQIREKVTVDGIVNQDTHTVYDHLNRISQLYDPRYHTAYSYDAAGNRTRTLSNYFDAAANVTSDLWFTYDSMNRVKINEGTGSAGQAVTINSSQGTQIEYNLRGDRVSATQYGLSVVQTSTSYTDGLGNNHPYTVFTDGNSSIVGTEAYSYDGMGRMLGRTRNDGAVTMEVRSYDGASRMVTQQTSPLTTSTTSSTLFLRLSTTQYDDDGRVKVQATYNSPTGELESKVEYGDATYVPAGQATTQLNLPTNQQVTISYPTAEYWTTGYDAAGTLHGYTVWVNSDSHLGTYALEHMLHYRKGDSFEEISDDVDVAGQWNSDGSTLLPSSTQRTYNVDGELVQYTDANDATRDRYFMNNQAGQAITVIQGSTNSAGVSALALSSIGGNPPNFNFDMQNFLFAAGKQIGTLHSTYTNNGTTHQTTANFDVAFTPVSNAYPGAVPQQVVAQEGDNLKLIALRVLGDANLWYLLGDANGLTDPNASITAGTLIKVPNNVVSLRNSAGNFKPFDAGAAIGDTTPAMGMMPAIALNDPSEPCGGFGPLIIMIVVIVVTVVTDGILTEPVAAAGATGGGAAAGATAAAASGLSATSAGVISAMVGNAAGQLVGMGIGLQHNFDWMSVAAAGLTAGAVASIASAAGAAGSVGRAISTNPVISGAIDGAINSVAGQGINIMLGLQDAFDWGEVAIGAVAGGLTRGVADKMNQLQAKGEINPTHFEHDMILGGTSAAVRIAVGGKVDTAQVVADIFGNAIGNSIVDKMQPTPVSTTNGNNHQQQSSSANTSTPSSEDDLSPVVVNLPPRPQSAATVDQTPGNDGAKLDGDPAQSPDSLANLGDLGSFPEQNIPVPNVDVSYDVPKSDAGDGLQEVVITGTRNRSYKVGWSDLSYLINSINKHGRPDVAGDTRLFDQDAIQYYIGSYNGRYRIDDSGAREKLYNALQKAENFNKGDAGLIALMPDGLTPYQKLKNAVAISGGYFSAGAAQNLFDQINAGNDALDLTYTRGQSEQYLDQLVKDRGIPAEALQTAMMMSSYGDTQDHYLPELNRRTAELAAQDPFLPIQLNIEAKGVMRETWRAVNYALMASGATDLLAGAPLILGARGLGTESIAGVNYGASSAMNAIRLRNQLTAEQIVGGHAFDKHVLGVGADTSVGNEFEGLGIRTRGQLQQHAEDVMNNSSAEGPLLNGRSFFYDDSTGTVVIRNPSSIDGGTIFRVDLRKYPNPYDYIKSLR
ncbi:MAG: hypothetical protein ABUL52_01500, partial [Solimonas sp.]